MFNKESDYYQMIDEKQTLPLGYKELHHYFNVSIPSEKTITEVESDQFLSVISKSRTERKYTIFYLYNNVYILYIIIQEADKVNLPLKMISNIPEYHKILNFYSINKPSKDVLNYAKLTSVKNPYLIMVMHDSKTEKR